MQALFYVLMDRFTRVHEEENGIFQDTPFDPARHQDKYAKIVDTYYPLARCFDAVEEALTADSNALLLTALQSRFGAPCEIDSCSLHLIQWGSQQTIFRVQVRIRVGEEEREVAFIAGASRHPEVTDMVKMDDIGITEMRRVEEEIPVAKPSFPLHYGARDTSVGPFVYLSEFCEGYVELNLSFEDDPHHSFAGDTTTRTIHLNGINQGTGQRTLGVEESSQILVEVMQHQLLTATRCGAVLAAAFGAGDYIYHPETKHLMLQCFRTYPFAGENGFWAHLGQRAELPGEDPVVLRLAFQLLEFATSKDGNRERETIEPEKPDEFSTYSFTDIVRAISGLKSDPKVLSPELWERVGKVAQSIANQVVPGLEISDLEKAVLLEKSRMVWMATQFA